MPSASKAPCFTIWAISDLHYGKIRDDAPEHLAALHRGVRRLRSQGRPAAVLIVGDVVDSADPVAYAEARADLAELFPEFTLYPAVGNHDFLGVPDTPTALAFFRQNWQLSHSYYRREIDGVPLLVLDMVPHPPSRGYVVPDDTLGWFAEELARIDQRFALIAEHCPLQDTVGDRDPRVVADYSTTNPDQPDFRLHNSAAVRDILARHPGPRLFLAGHTHSGWDAPNLVKTERLGGKPVTFVNLMSPHFTGIHAYHNDPDTVMLWQADIAEGEVRLTAHDVLNSAIARVWDIPLQ